MIVSESWAVACSDEATPKGIGTRALRLAAWFTRAKYTHGALVCVCDASGRILLVRQRFRERGAWGMPGGFLAPNELPVSGAAREMREEVGIDLPIADLVLVDEYCQPWAWHYEHLFAVCLEGRITPSQSSFELVDAAWFDLSGTSPKLTAAAREGLRRMGEFSFSVNDSLRVDGV